MHLHSINLDAAPAVQLTSLQFFVKWRTPSQSCQHFDYVFASCVRRIVGKVDGKNGDVQCIDLQATNGETFEISTGTLRFTNTKYLTYNCTINTDYLAVHFIEQTHYKYMCICTHVHYIDIPKTFTYMYVALVNIHTHTHIYGTYMHSMHL